MLVPKWILGGILAATLGLTGGQAAQAESPPPPGASYPMTAPEDGTDALLRVAAPGQIFLLDAPRPEVRPARITIRPMAREDIIPETRWDGRSDGDDWTRAALEAINQQRHDLSDIVPQDIAQWCPAYEDNPERLRDAFWVGMMSALARHESTLNPSAVGGGGLYYGLLQIYPATARNYGCAATTGQGLRDPEENLACAVRIMATTVRRDDAVAVYDGRWRGVAADWGPMTNSGKRAEMSAWTREQDYCTLSTAVFSAPIPPERPWTLTEAHNDIPVAQAVELAMLIDDLGYLRSVQ